MTNKELQNLTHDDIYEIAKIIDNEYTGRQEELYWVRGEDKYSLTTTNCDWASNILFTQTDPVKISTVGPHDTRSIMPATQRLIDIYLRSPRND